MKKGLILGVIVLSVLSLAVFGEGLLQTLGQLLVSGAENSIQGSIDQLNGDILKVKLEDANKEADKNKVPGGTRVDLLKKDLIVNIDTLTAKQALDYQTLEANKNQYTLKRDIEVATQDYALVLEEIRVAKLNLPVAEKEVAIAKTQQRLGMVTNLAVLEKENAVASQRLSLITLDQSRYEKALALEGLVGAALEGALLVDYKIELKPRFGMSIQVMLDGLVKRQLSVFKAQQALTVKEKTFNYTDTYYDELDKEYKEALYNLEIARLEYQDAYEAAKIDLLTAFEQVGILYESYLLEKDFVALNEARLADTQKKKSLGTASELEVLQAQVQLRNKKLDVTKAIVAYNKAYLDFKLKLQDFAQ